MVKVSVYKNENNEYVGFTACGHAGYAESGEDVVCAAISILTINTINAIEEFTDVKSSLTSNDKEGRIDYRITGTPTKESELLFKAMVLGLQNLEEEESYSAYIDLIFEEV